MLYVFNKYHDSIDSPLTVLYNFLVEFSSFDWDHYCLSLLGPVPLKDLPKLDGKSCKSSFLDSWRCRIDRHRRTLVYSLAVAFGSP